MSIMDFFKTPEPVAAGIQAPVSPPVPPSPPTTPDGKMPGTNQGHVNPLDAYAKVFENVNTPGDIPPSFTIDPKVLSEVSGSLNFTNNIPADLMQKATSGDANAMVQLMNHVAQQAYQASLHHSSALTDKFVNARSSFDLKSVGSKVKGELTNTAMAAIPNYKHPAVKLQLNMIADAMSRQNPDASPQEIAKAASQYIQDLASAINPTTGNSQQSKESSGEDWSAYFA